MKSYISNKFRQRGASLVVVLGAMIPAIGVTAFVVDYGRYYVMSNELRNVADSAALAAASNINSLQNDGFWTDRWSDACSDAELYATQKNKVDGNSLAAADIEVALGYWDATKPKDTAFTQLSTCPATPALMTFAANQFPSVQVKTFRVDGRPSGPLPTFFGGVVGVAFLDANATAVASVARAESVRAMPFGFAQCAADIMLDDVGTGNIKPAYIGYKIIAYQSNVNKTNEIGCVDDTANRILHVPAQWVPLCINSQPSCGNGISFVNDRLEGDTPLEMVSVRSSTEVRDGSADPSAVNDYFDPLVSNQTGIAAPIIANMAGENFDTGVTGEIHQFIGVKPLTDILVKKVFPPCSQPSCTKYDTLEFEVTTAIDFDATPDSSGTTSGSVLTNPFLVL